MPCQSRYSDFRHAAMAAAPLLLFSRRHDGADFCDKKYSIMKEMLIHIQYRGTEDTYAA